MIYVNYILSLFAILLMVLWPQENATAQWFIRLYIVSVAVVNIFTFCVSTDVEDENKEEGC